MKISSVIHERAWEKLAARIRTEKTTYSRNELKEMMNECFQEAVKEMVSQ